MGVLLLNQEDAPSFSRSTIELRREKWRAKALNARALLAGLFVKPWLRYFLLAAAGFGVHIPALSGQFLWDDTYLARDNPFIKSPLLALEAFRHHLFLDSFSAHYRPVQNLSFMVDYYFWNTESAGFHLTNILLHVAGGLLLYRLLCALFQREGGLWPRGVSFSPEWCAFVVAALWVVHPVHSAAVDYISGRADSLAFLFSAAAWLLHLRAAENRWRWSKWTCNLLAASVALLALCSREIAGIWLLLFLLHTLLCTKASAKRKILVVACGLLIAGAYAGLRQLPGARAATITTDNWPLALRATLMLRALGDYAHVLFWPDNLHMERSIFDPDAYRNHDHWRAAAALEYVAVLGMCVAASLLFGCIRRGAGQRLRIAGAVWFVAGYLPVSNIVQLNATVAEHWLYLPSAGAFIFLLGYVLDLPTRASRWLAPIAAIAIISLGVRSAIRSSDWRDDETFFTRTAAAGGWSGRIMVNLAQCYAARGLYAKAEQICRRVLQLDPHYSIARNNLGFVLSREGKKAEAEALFAQSSKEAALYANTYPRTWLAARNYAQLRHGAGDNAGAIAALETARRQYPDTWELISLESELLRETHGVPAALNIVRDFAERNWWHYAARLAEGRLYAEADEIPAAEKSLRAAAMLDVHDAEALNLLARIYARQNQLEHAREIQSRAVARQPDQPRQYLMLATILEKMGRGGEVEAVLAKASQLRAMATTAPEPLALAN